AAYVDEAEGDVHGERRDDHALYELMRVVLQEVAVLERAGFGLVRVAHQVAGSAVRRRHERPLDARGEAGAASAAKAGGLQLVYHRGWGHGGKHLARRLVTAAALVAL